MKKLVLFLLSSLLILSACGKEPQKEELSLRLLDNCVSDSDNPNLFIIPNEDIAEMIFPEIYYLGDNLLFFSTVYDVGIEAPVSDDENALYETCTAQLKLISIEDGSLLAERDFPSMYTPMVQTEENLIALNDIATGSVLILDEKLEIVKEYRIEGSVSSVAYLDEGFDTIYIFDYQNGLYRQKLGTEERETVAEGYGVFPCSAPVDNLYFYYTDKETQRCLYRYIDLETNTVSPIPTDTPADSCDSWGSTLLLRNKHDYYECELIKDNESFYFSSSDLSAALSDNGHLIVRNDTCTDISVYDTDGSFISSVSFDEEYEHSVFPESILWSELYNGYFFIDNGGEDSVFMFLSADIPVSGSDLPLRIKTEEEVPEGSILSPELYERAEEMSEKYDLDIRIGERCELDYEEQYLPTTIITDNYEAEYALDVLEGALESYPEGFFTQLKYEDISEIRIELIGPIPDAGGFAQNKGDYYLIAIDGTAIDHYVVSHELSHVIDRRLEWDASLRDDALYSEETWLSLQPEGFDYAYSYDDVPDELYEYYYQTCYFERPYAVTYPTEDRATLFGAAMDDYYTDWFATIDNTYLFAKLDYYSRCIRDCFDTEGWPEVTEWEELLG